MKQPKRYDLVPAEADDVIELMERPNGHWVEYLEYKRLRSQMSYAHNLVQQLIDATIIGMGDPDRATQLSKLKKIKEFLSNE